jgi:hypothetical protein
LQKATTNKKDEGSFRLIFYKAKGRQFLELFIQITERQLNRYFLELAASSSLFATVNSFRPSKAQTIYAIDTLLYGG